MKTSRLLLAAMLLSSACRRAPRKQETLPTPMSLDTPAGGRATATPPPSTPVSNTGASSGVNRPPQIVAASIDVLNQTPGDGHPNAADTLKANVKATDPDSDLVTLKYDWTVNGQSKGSGETLAPGGFKKKDGVNLNITATDSHGAVSTRSVTAEIRNSAPQITSTPGASLNGYHPTAVDPDGDAVTIDVVSPPPGFTFAGGTIVFDPASGKAAAGKSITIVAKDPDGATATQSISINF